MTGLFGGDMNVEQARAVTCSFGKHRGRPLGAVVDEDLLYLDFLAGVEIRDPTMRRAVRVLHDEYAGEIDRLVEERE